MGGPVKVMTFTVTPSNGFSSSWATATAAVVVVSKATTARAVRAFVGFRVIVSACLRWDWARLGSDPWMA